MKPILFNTDMVRAILEGRKTVTRRVVKPQPWGTCPNTGGDHELKPDNFFGGVATGFVCGRCGLGVCPPHMKYPVGEALFRPMCWPGDILYVRETWYKDPTRYMYKANYSDTEKFFRDGKEVQIKWRPSIHMPKEAARLFLRVTDVRAERLQAITIEDIQKEGLMRENVRSTGCTCAWATDGCMDEPCSNRDSYEWLCWATPFQRLWDSTVKATDRDQYGWSANPWVWVIEFERVSKEAALKGGAK